jgi:hypothetical protein
VKQATGVRLAKRVQPMLLLAMPLVFDHQQRFIQKHLFGLRLAYAVFVFALATISVIPIEADNAFEIDSHCILL